MNNLHNIRVSVNGSQVDFQVESRRLLSDWLRDDLGLTGTHVGCEHGICGACTILFNGEAARSCLMFAVQADGAEISTIEGLSTSGAISRLQTLFADAHALQCGFCTPAMLITAHDLLRHGPPRSAEEVREGMSAALCRCTGYQGIIKAVTQAASEVSEQAADGSEEAPSELALTNGAS